MFSDSDTLWNCLTLATVSLTTRGPDGKDKIADSIVTETDKMFQVGEFSTFDFPFIPYRACMQKSCSDSEFGDCSARLNNLLDSPINNTGIERFSTMLTGSYCQRVDVGIDFDIAGPGIITAYFIQFGLVFFMALSFKFTNSWTKKLLWPFYLMFKDYQASVKSSVEAQDQLRRTRFAKAVESCIIDLQETQALFLTTVAGAAIAICTNNNGSGLANVPSLQSWLINNSVLKGIVTAGSYSLLLIQLILHRSKKHWWYTMLFIGVYVILVANQPLRADISTVLDAVTQIGLNECGDQPSPKTFCLTFGSSSTSKDSPWLHNVFRLPPGVFSLNSRYQEPVYLISAVLVIDWMVHFVLDERNRVPERFKPFIPGFSITMPSVVSKYWPRALKGFWIVFEVTVFAMCILAIAELQHFLGILADQGDELANTYNISNWSFGQFVAVAVWFPIMSKFVSYIVVGIIDSVERRLDGRYEVRFREHQRDDYELTPMLPSDGEIDTNIERRGRTTTFEMEGGTLSARMRRTA